MLTNFRKFPLSLSSFQTSSKKMFTWYSEGSSARKDQTSQTEGNTAVRGLCLSISFSCQVFLVALAVPSMSHLNKERTLQPAAAIWNCASCILGCMAPPPTKSEQNVQPNNHHPAAKLTPAIQWSQMQINSLAFVWWCNCQTAHSNEYLFNCVIHR